MFIVVKEKINRMHDITASFSDIHFCSESKEQALDFAKKLFYFTHFKNQDNNNLTPYNFEHIDLFYNKSNCFVDYTYQIFIVEIPLDTVFHPIPLTLSNLYGMNCSPEITFLTEQDIKDLFRQAVNEYFSLFEISKLKKTDFESLFSCLISDPFHGYENWKKNF